MKGITEIITKLASNTPKYRPPRLADHNGDMSKRWYIDYYVPDEEGKIYRKQYTGMNKFKTLKSRYNHSHYMLREISKLLKAGFIADIQTNRPKKVIPPDLYEWSKVVHALKKNELRKKSADYYRLFSDKLKDMPEGKIKIHKLVRSDLIKIQNTLINSGLAPKSVNNHMGILSSLLNKALDEDLIQINPYRNIQKLKHDSGRHFPYTKAQLQLITSYLAKKNPQLLLYIHFLFYTLARPNEIRLMKVGDIKDEQVWIPAEHSKVRKSRFAVLPTHLQKIIGQFEIREHLDHYYIFGNTGEPGKEPRGKNYFGWHHRNMLNYLKLTDKPFDLYGYKHSGAIALVNAGVDIKFIQNQCGHSTVAQTDQYLKDIGAIRGNEILINNYPEMGG